MMVFCRSLPVSDTWEKVQVASPRTQEKMIYYRVNGRLPVFDEWPRSANLDSDGRIVVDTEGKRKYEALLKAEEEKEEQQQQREQKRLKAEEKFLERELQRKVKIRPALKNRKKKAQREWTPEILEPAEDIVDDPIPDIINGRRL
jgi:hypothetical protein